ncbi:transcription factor TFIIF complex subunit Tfg3 [Mucor circinelloides]
MMEKRLKINCSSKVIKDRFTNNGDVWRAWTVTLEVPNVDLSKHIDHVEYVLHASFGLPPVVCAEPPYQLQKEGWGEFDLLIQLFFKDSLLPSPQNYIFDLNFKKSKYANWRRIILGSDAEYKQEERDEDYMIEFATDRDRQARARRRRRPTVKYEQQQQQQGPSSKKPKKVFKRQRTANSGSSSSSPSSSSATSLVTPPADNNNKDLQQHQHQQHQDVVQQESIQSKQTSVCRSPHYILDPANDLSLVLDTETIDLAELKALLEGLDDTHLRQAYGIMKKYDTSKMSIQTTDDGYYLIDINTACSDFINELWEFVIDVEIEKCKESSTLSEHQHEQQQQH